jgi:hypothetical protein
MSSNTPYNEDDNIDLLFASYHGNLEENELNIFILHFYN